MREPFADSPEFQKLLAGQEPTVLCRLALEIARDAYPEMDVERYLRKIEALADRVRDRCPRPSKLRQVLGQINWVLFVEEGYEGNTDDYYDSRNSYLNEVVDRKRGIPISLSVLYATIAERVGVVMAGVNLPVHFMLRADDADETIFVDAFNSGTLLDRRGCEQRIAEFLGQPIVLDEKQVAPCGNDQIVSRMLRNLKAIYLRNHEFFAALRVQQRLTALNRSDPHEQRDLGMLCVQLELPGDAVGPLESYLAQRPDADDADPIRALLRAARREVAAWN